MKPLTLVTLPFLSVLVGCAGLQHDRQPKEESRQRPEEAGLLAVGRIVSVEQLQSSNYRGLAAEEDAAVRSVSPMGPALVAAFYAVRTINWSYRYTIQLKTGEKRQLEAIHVFPENECVALRPGLNPDDVAMVLALPGQCEKAAESSSNS